MIHLAGLSFGYGFCVGLTITVLKENIHLNSLTNKQGCVPIIPFLPDIPTFSRFAKTPNIEFLIIPPCSPYSHLAANIWSSNIPTIAIQRPDCLSDGVTVFADFEKGLLLVAESDSEAELLRHRAKIDSINSSIHNSSLKPHDRSLHSVKILAETNSANELIQALDSGADGLSIIKSEDLFHDVIETSSDPKALISIVKANPQLLPLRVRFFDSGPEIYDTSKEFQMPSKYLGYRGVRILEQSDIWLQRFLTRLERLELAQVTMILPMITSLSEVRRIQKRLDPNWIRVGITVETPAAALRINEFLEISEFIEIGLNDLTQYTMAWDRDVPNKDRLPNDHIVEPVADLIASVATACSSAGVSYALGLDLRPSENLATQILQLGVASISCPFPLVKPWKRILAFNYPTL